MEPDGISKWKWFGKCIDYKALKIIENQVNPAY